MIRKSSNTIIEREKRYILKINVDLRKIKLYNCLHFFNSLALIARKLHI